MVTEFNILEKAEDQHHKFQIGMYFSNMKKTPEATFLWSDKIIDSDWNFASKINVSEKNLENFVEQVIEFYKSKNRNPAIYTTPFTNPKNISNLIEKFGFKLEFTDLWMFYEKDQPKIKIPNNFTIKEVKTEEEMELFVKIFYKAYSGETEEETYGELPKEYSETLFDSFKNEQINKKIIHYLGFLGDVAISIATLIYSKDYAGIYNVGTIPNERKKGIGSALTLNCVNEAFNNNVKHIFLQTEEGSYNEKYYNKLKFDTKFSGKCFVLEVKK